MWGLGFILTQINCAFSQMHAHTHTTTTTPTAPKTSIPLDLNRLRWFEMRTMIYWQRLGEVGVGWWKFMLGTAEVVTEQGWGGVFRHVSVSGGLGESFYFGETTAVAFSHAEIPVSKLYAWASTVNHTVLKCISYLHICQVSPTWYSSEYLQSKI